MLWLAVYFTKSHPSLRRYAPIAFHSDWSPFESCWFFRKKLSRPTTLWTTRSISYKQWVRLQNAWQGAYEFFGDTPNALRNWTSWHVSQSCTTNVWRAATSIWSRKAGQFSKSESTMYRTWCGRLNLATWRRWFWSGKRRYVSSVFLMQTNFKLALLPLS